MSQFRIPNFGSAPWRAGGNKNPTRWDDWGTRPPVPPFSKFDKRELKNAFSYFQDYPQQYLSSRFSDYGNQARQFIDRYPYGRSFQYRFSKSSRRQFAPSLRRTRYSRSWMTKLICYYCGRKGHIARYCPYR